MEEVLTVDAEDFFFAVADGFLVLASVSEIAVRTHRARSSSRCCGEPAWATSAATTL